MDYQKEIDAFLKYLQHNTNLSSSARLLYHTLLMINSQCNWADDFEQTNSDLCELLNVSANTLKTARRELKDAGLIDYASATTKFNKSRYKIFRLHNKKVFASVKDSLVFKVSNSDTLNVKNKLKVSNTDTLSPENIVKVSNIDTLNEENKPKVSNSDTLNPENNAKVSNFDTLNSKSRVKVSNIDTLMENITASLHSKVSNSDSLNISENDVEYPKEKNKSSDVINKEIIDSWE